MPLMGPVQENQSLRIVSDLGAAASSLGELWSRNRRGLERSIGYHQAASSIVAVLAASGRLSIVCDADRRVIAFAPGALEAMDAGGHLHLDSDRLLGEGLAPGMVDAVTVSAGVNAWRVGYAEVVELTGLELFGARWLIVSIPRMAANPTARPRTTMRALRLTVAEQEVARALTQGRRPRTIALDRSVSIHTVRSQIKAIYAKASVSSPTELLQLLCDLDEPKKPPRDAGCSRRST